MYAVNDGNVAMTEFLLNRGADVKKKNKRGLSPLGIAAKYENKKMIDLLLDYGADVNVTDNRGKKPVDYVKSEELKEMLTSKDKSLNQKGHKALKDKLQQASSPQLSDKDVKLNKDIINETMSSSNKAVEPSVAITVVAMRKGR